MIAAVFFADEALAAGLLTSVHAPEDALEKRPPVFTTTVEGGLPEWLPWISDMPDVTGK